MNKLKTAWVLSWKYSDGSGGKVVRVYSNEQNARKECTLVNDGDNLRIWTLESIPFNLDIRFTDE